MYCFIMPSEVRMLSTVAGWISVKQSLLLFSWVYVFPSSFLVISVNHIGDNVGNKLNNFPWNLVGSKRNTLHFSARAIEPQTKTQNWRVRFLNHNCLFANMNYSSESVKLYFMGIFNYVYLFSKSLSNHFILIPLQYWLCIKMISRYKLP